MQEVEVFFLLWLLYAGLRLLRLQEGWVVMRLLDYAVPRGKLQLLGGCRKSEVLFGISGCTVFEDGFAKEINREAGG